jgi:hypothetical protein
VGHSRRSPRLNQESTSGPSTMTSKGAGAGLGQTPAVSVVSLSSLVSSGFDVPSLAVSSAGRVVASLRVVPCSGPVVEVAPALSAEVAFASSPRPKAGLSRVQPVLPTITVSVASLNPIPERIMRSLGLDFSTEGYPADMGYAVTVDRGGDVRSREHGLSVVAARGSHAHRVSKIADCGLSCDRAASGSAPGLPVPPSRTKGSIVGVPQAPDPRGRTAPWASILAAGFAALECPQELVCVLPLGHPPSAWIGLQPCLCGPGELECALPVG